MATSQTYPRRFVGQPVARREDPRLLRGQGLFGADLVLPHTVEVVFVRSHVAHGVLRKVYLDPASSLPGVVAVLGAADLANVLPITSRLAVEWFRPTPWPPLAKDLVRYVGEPVAAVVATNRYLAEDALDAIELEIEPLPSVVSVAEGLRGDVLLHPELGSNVLWEGMLAPPGLDEALAASPVHVKVAVGHDRSTASPLEPRVIAAAYDRERGLLTLYAATQVPHIIRAGIAACLGMDRSAVRVVVPDVGGGFGQKMHLLPEEVVVAALARQLERPVRWVEDRRENLLAAAAGRDQTVEVEAGTDREGHLTALRATICADVGAYHIYPHTAALEPLGTGQIIPGPYRVPLYGNHARAIATNKPPVGALRGVGQVIGVLAMERLMDRLAEVLELDPAEVRRRNLIPRDEMPYQSPSGLRYDSGDFARTLESALTSARYDTWREHQREALRENRFLGVGIALFTEYTGMGPQTFARRGMIHIPGHDGAFMQVRSDGLVEVHVSSPSQGQGHETTFAQLVADVVGVPLELVDVVPVDTASAPDGTGTFASRSSVSTAGAIFLASQELRRRILQAGAHLLEAHVDDLVLHDGSVWIRGAPTRQASVAEVADYVARASVSLVPLEAAARYEPPPATFSNAAHIAVVEVDADIAQVTILDYTVAEDCGPLINPLVAEGQVQGAVAEGIGEALLEALVYDSDGQPLATTFMDYLLPTASQVPSLRIVHLETPAPDNPWGSKGIGEGGTIGAPAALLNAVCDALRPFGVLVNAVPISAQRIFAQLSQKKRSP